MWTTAWNESSHLRSMRCSHQRAIYHSSWTILVLISFYLLSSNLSKVSARNWICRRKRPPLLWRVLWQILGTGLWKVSQENPWELFEGHGQNISSWMFCLRLLWKNLCQLSILFGRRIALLRRRLEWIVHNQMCLLWLSDRSRWPLGRGS